jgi:hypothetical protein
MPVKIPAQRCDGAADGPFPAPVVVAVIADVDRLDRDRQHLGQRRGEPVPIQLPGDQESVVHGWYVPS